MRTIPTRIRAWLDLAVDVLRAVASVFARPSTVDAIASRHVDVCEGADPPAWARCIARDIDTDVELRVAEWSRRTDFDVVAHTPTERN